MLRKSIDIIKVEEAVSDSVVQLPIRRHWFTQQVTHIIQHVSHMRSDNTPSRIEVYLLLS